MIDWRGRGLGSSQRQIGFFSKVQLLPTVALAPAGGISFHNNRGDWDRSRSFCISFCVGYFVFCALVWWLNQNARKKTLEPLHDALPVNQSAGPLLDGREPFRLISMVNPVCCIWRPLAHV
jgi:hypothetical protein